MNSMLKVLVFLFVSFASWLDLPAQMLILDRGPSSGSNQLVGLTKESNAFLADDFQVGVAPEVWVIDHIRLWAVPDPKASSAHGPGDLFTKINLYGGIAPDMPPPDQKATADCDCHNLPALKTAVLEPGSHSTDSPDVVVSSRSQHDGPGAWQLDFENLKWSVPGATSIQFGILAEARQGNDPAASYTWYYLASPGPGGDHLRVFSSLGKLQSSYQNGGNARVNIQVWGHLLARISIRSSGQNLRVILRSEPSLKANQVDTASLRFGPRGAPPDKVRTEDVDHNGKPDLVLYFRSADSGIPVKSVNACLSGKRLDGAPFEGCDLLPH